MVFDQSKYVKLAIANVLREGSIGLFLTAVMILVFLGSLRGTISVLLSIPISCLAAFLLLNALGSTINTIVLGGLALVLSRLIDNSVVVLGKHLPPPGRWAKTRTRLPKKGASEVAARRSRSNLHHRDCFLPGGLSCQVSASISSLPWLWE